MTPNRTPLLSIVVPLFNEASNIEVLFERIKRLESKLVNQLRNPFRVEVIFVDDGSKDGCFTKASNIAGFDPNVRLVRFANNAGSHAAIMAGMQEARGDCAIFLAGDLQDPPELIVDMLKDWQNGMGIVWAARTSIEGQKNKDRWFSTTYWRLVNFITGMNLPDGGVDFFLIDRQVINIITAQAHRHAPIFLLVAETGFPSTVIFYKKAQRQGGKSGWTLKKKLMLTFETMLFSFKPVRLMSLLGLAITAFGIMAAFLMAALNLTGTTIHFSLPIIDAVAIIGGLQMILIGLIGEYVNLTLKETRNVPRFIIAEKINCAPDSTQVLIPQHLPTTQALNTFSTADNNLTSFAPQAEPQSQQFDPSGR